MPTQAEIAALLQRMAKLEAAEDERNRAAAEQKLAQSKLEQMNPRLQSNVEVKSLGTATAYRQCSQPRCAEFDVKYPVEIAGEEAARHARDMDGNVLSTVENSHRIWHLVEPSEGHCPSCGRNCGFVGEPGSVNALEGSSGWVHDNRSAWLEKLKREGRSEADIKAWSQRWVEDANKKVQEAVEDGL
jgi:hypothetical protein